MKGTHATPDLSLGSGVPLDVKYASYFLEPTGIHEGTFVTRFHHPEWGRGWLLAEAPEETIVARQAEDVLALLDAAGRWEGFVGLVLPYEAAAGIHPHLPAKSLETTFFGWVGHYRGPLKFYTELAPVETAPEILEVAWDYDRESYDRSFDQVKASLGAGDFYQTNLTDRLRFRASCSTWDLFVSRVGVDPPPYATFVQLGDSEVTSWSPELFVERTGSRVQMKPMKGTAPRSEDPTSLLTHKTFAENLMIVDMVRNDLGMVAEVGSVRVPELFTVEPHRSVWQMTSTVEAMFQGPIVDLLKAVFPPASVTGAPKRAACEAINRLEGSPRGVYCGSIGYLAGSGDLRLSVGIRTAHVRGGEGVYGVGSGLVWDSDRDLEFDECRLKAEVFLKPGSPWRLLETMALDVLAEGTLLELHLDRLRRSCQFFEIPFDRPAILAALASVSPVGWDARESRIRLTLSRAGEPSVEVNAARTMGSPLKFRLATKPVESQDPSLRHKTTARQLYQQHLDSVPKGEEVLLFNERGEVTEFCTGAFLAKFGGLWVTPPAECGCLPSVGLARHEAERRIILLSDLSQAEEIYMVNARGAWLAEQT